MEFNSRLLKYQNHLLKKNLISYLGFYLCMYLLVYTQYFILNKFGASIEFIRIGINHDGFVSVAGASFFISPIMLLIFGIVEYYENFALAFSLSSTRKKYYVSAIYSNISMSLGFGFIATIIFFLDKLILKAIELNALTNFLIFDTTVDGPIKVFLILFGINLLLISIGNFIGTLVYKFGYKFWIAFGILFAITMMAGIPALTSGATFIGFIGRGIVSIAKMIIESIGIIPSIILYGTIQTIVLYIGSFFIIKTVNIGK